MEDKVLRSAFIRPSINSNLENIFTFLCDFSGQRISAGMGLAGFDYDKLYNLADRRKIDLDAYKWATDIFENALCASENNKDKEDG